MDFATDFGQSSPGFIQLDPGPFTVLMFQCIGFFCILRLEGRPTLVQLVQLGVGILQQIADAGI